MTAMKRVEIVTDSLELSAVCNALNLAGVSGYTVLRDVTGKGNRGDRIDDDMTGALRNVYVLCGCTEPQARAVAEAMRGILRLSGGVCLISDCLWVEH
jgi:nitrogen regulatory protein PII